MEYKAVRKQLRRMAFTERYYSITKASKLVAKIRSASSFIFVISALSFLYSGSYLDALKSLLYAVGLYYLGYLRGLVLPVVIILAEALWLGGYIQNSNLTLVTFSLIVLVIAYRCYVRFVRDACYINISGYKRDDEFVEYDDALAQFAPISEYNACLELKLKIPARNEAQLLRKYEATLRVIAEVSRRGFRQNLICAGFVSSAEGNRMSIFFYTTEEKKARKSAYLEKFFCANTETEVSISSISDPDWEIYNERLVPNLYERQEIYNTNYLRYLENSNIDFEEPHKLFYRFKLKSRNELNKFIDELKGLGYEAAKEFPANLVCDDGSIMLVVYKYGRIGQYRVNMITKQFVDIASSYNVEFYDWVLGGEDEYRY